MFIISGGIGTGKTRALIERAKTDNGIIVCKDPNAMRERAHKYGITGLNIISYDELYENMSVDYSKPMYVHDINKFITHRFHEVKGYSVCF